MTEITWYNKRLNGTINGTAIPSNVVYLSLSYNFVAGRIPNSLPTGLRHLYLHSNLITGSIPNALPSGLLHLWIYGNQMSGDLPFFPSTLQYLYLGYPGYPGNHFTGSLKIYQPIQLNIIDNWITDVVINNSSVLATGGFLCDLSNNPLLGNPNIAGLLMCTKNGLYSAGFLPETRTMEFDSTTIKSLNAMEMDSTGVGKMASVTREVTSAMTDVTSIMVTVAFVQEMNELKISLGMMARCIISAMLLTFVTSRTPFGREFKKMLNKGKTKTTMSLQSFK